MARLRTNSAFQRLTAAYASNEMGVTIAYILIPLVILDLTGSATNAGLVTALATTASTVAGIMSGAIADRSNPSFLLRLSFRPGVPPVGATRPPAVARHRQRGNHRGSRHHHLRRGGD